MHQHHLNDNILLLCWVTNKLSVPQLLSIQAHTEQLCPPEEPAHCRPVMFSFLPMQTCCLLCDNNTYILYINKHKIRFNEYMFQLILRNQMLEKWKPDELWTHSKICPLIEHWSDLLFFQSWTHLSMLWQEPICLCFFLNVFFFSIFMAGEIRPLNGVYSYS